MILSDLDLYVVYLFAALVLLPLIYAIIGVYLTRRIDPRRSRPCRRPVARRAR